MCGIAGILGLDQAQDVDTIKAMCDRLIHRGPDGEGFHIDGTIALGHRRLSIIDLEGGRQPMTNEDGSVWLVFNGEIYNFQELRRRLEGQGHRFATQSDTETVLHAYEQYGTNCVQELRGMFAFAIWDSAQRTLFLARDRVGKKPLFYAQTPRKFVFASELHALLAHPAIDKTIDYVALDEYLTYGYVPAPRTIFRGVSKLLPAHWHCVRANRDGTAWSSESECYWRLPYAPKKPISEEEAAEGLLDKLKEAIKLRLIADVPLGALLSGGVDSSIVVALMSQLSSFKVKTFSIGFDEREYSELPHAKAVAERYGTLHHEMIVRPDAVAILPKLVRHFGEPFADSSAIPSYYVAQLTRQHVTVALNGDGGDESFAGYERYLGSRLADRYRRIPALVRGGLRQLAQWSIPESLPRRNRLRQAKRFLQAADLPLGERYLRWVSYFTSHERHNLYTDETREQLGSQNGDRWLLDLLAKNDQNGNDPLDILLATDVQSYLPYDLLVKMDIATMANSLEARSPFLDHHVMEFAATLPPSMKLRGTKLKYLLKKVGVKLLPQENLKRRKMGFGVPVGDWMRREMRPFVQDTLLASDARVGRFLRLDAVRDVAETHFRGELDQAYSLWALLWLEVWLRDTEI